MGVLLLALYCFVRAASFHKRDGICTINPPRNGSYGFTCQSRNRGVSGIVQPAYAIDVATSIPKEISRTCFFCSSGSTLKPSLCFYLLRMKVHHSSLMLFSLPNL